MLAIIENSSILIPWPTLYEVLNTTFIAEKPWIEKFDQFLRKPTITKVDDSLYKEQALIQTMAMSREKGRNISLVDRVIRQMVADVNLKIDHLVTFNYKDFNDVIKKRGSVTYYYG